MGRQGCLRVASARVGSDVRRELRALQGNRSGGSDQSWSLRGLSCRYLIARTENDLTAWFAQLFGPVAQGEIWTGDDAALVRTSPNTLLTVDSMSEHVDFELGWATGGDLGYKLVAINVSDIAAMGGRPTRAVATIQLGEETTTEVVEEIAVGMAEAAAKWGLSVVGGDIGRGSELAVSMTILGHLSGAPVLRSGARRGHAICVTGALGAAHAGLLLLQLGIVDLESVRDEIMTGSQADGLAVLAAAQLRPQARLLEGLALSEIVSSMIDISDGLAADLERLCLASGVGCDVQSASIPLHVELEHAAATVRDFPDPLECAILGGEDFELLFTVPPDNLDAVHQALDELGTSVSVLGEVTEGGCKIDERPIEDWSGRGWDHLRIE